MPKNPALNALDTGFFVLLTGKLGTFLLQNDFFHNFFARYCLKIFSKTVNLFKKRDEIASKYDIIEEKSEWTLFGAALPVTVTEEKAVPYEMKMKIRTEAECRGLADSAMAKLCSEELDRAEVLERRTEWIKTETGYRLQVQLDCLLDIAKEVPISQE